MKLHLRRTGATRTETTRTETTRTETTRYVPKHASVPLPGLSGLRFHPSHVRRGALASVCCGMALFVFAGLTTADASTPRHQNHAAAQRATSTVPAVPVATSSTSAAPVQTLSAAPVIVAKPAPATKKVITGLAANGIPNVALNAYRVAAARMASADPGCGIDWALLAGIGREESDHGQFDGAHLNANGTSTPRIIGPALDGVHWDYVAAPANGMALDGDAVYAHALGPMQFIPSTWAIYGADANGDGVADVFNINDAALGAARYLCAAGGDLRTHAGQVRAVLAYNHNNTYLAQVLALAAAYRSGVKVTGIPLVGTTTGSLPPIHHTGGTPPVNPGGPTALDPTGSTPTKTTSSTASSGPHSPAGASSTRASTPTPTPTKTPTTAAPTPTPTKTKTSSKPTPTPTPTPTSTCYIPVGKICLLPK